MKNEVILVDKNDRQVGTMDKIEAHEKGELHRAFSVFVFNPEGKMMLQRRALSKYHSPGLWTNTCCSHQKVGETDRQAARRRLIEEMGFTCRLKKAFHFIYKSEVGQGLTEYELDHVFIGEYGRQPAINKEEVEEWKFSALPDIERDLAENPEKYTVWFRMTFQWVKDYLEKRSGKEQ